MSTVSLPFHMWEGLSLWVVPPDHGLLRTTRVCAARQGNSNTLILKLEGVQDIATAQRLVGRSLLVLQDDCSVDFEQAKDQDSWLGLRVVDKTLGFVGVIVAEHTGSQSGVPAQALWVVDGPFGEVLIPAVEAFLQSTTQSTLQNSDEKTVYVELPKGLVELNK